MDEEERRLLDESRVRAEALAELRTQVHWVQAKLCSVAAELQAIVSELEWRANAARSRRAATSSEVLRCERGRLR